MNWTSKIYAYCERGIDAGFWAEPLNAVSNGAFWIAAIAAFASLWRAGDTFRRPAETALCIMVAVIGTGSFLFHTYATAWAALADVAPIGLFMFAYVGYTVRRFLGLNLIAVALAIACFIAAFYVARTMACPPLLADIVSAARGRCLNGTFSYVPALLALAVMTVSLALRRHPAWMWLAAASAVFLCAMTFRTFDFEWCDSVKIGGYATGTHFLWHVLNAVTLYLLLIAAICTGNINPPGAVSSGRAKAF